MDDRLTRATDNRWIFTGIVHPARANVMMSVVLRLQHADAGVDGELDAHVQLGLLTATFQPTSTFTGDIYTLKNLVEDSLRLPVDALGYANGCGYDVEIVSAIPLHDGAPVVFGVGIPLLAKYSSDAGISFDYVMELFQNPRSGHLQRSLADLREAARVAKDAAFFSYRAIESIRQYYVDVGGATSDKESWELLRAELGVSRDELDVVHELAKAVRHGGGAYLSGEQRGRAMLTAWRVVHAFIEYAKRGYAAG